VAIEKDWAGRGVEERRGRRYGQSLDKARSPIVFVSLKIPKKNRGDHFAASYKTH